MAQIFLALNFGEMGALESAENSDFFHVRKNLYAQSAQNLTSDQPPPSYMEPLLNDAHVLVTKQREGQNISGTEEGRF